ncbi:hypothetical protein NKH77_49050 [Streptomyces sp. M19]
MGTVIAHSPHHEVNWSIHLGEYRGDRRARRPGRRSPQPAPARNPGTPRRLERRHQVAGQRGARTAGGPATVGPGRTGRGHTSTWGALNRLETEVASRTLFTRLPELPRPNPSTYRSAFPRSSPTD